MTTCPPSEWCYWLAFLCFRISSHHNFYQSCKLRPCVLVTVSGFWVILGKYTGKVESRKSNISVHFRRLPKRRKCVDCRKIPVISGIIYRNFRPFLEPFLPFLEPKSTVYVKNFESNRKFWYNFDIFGIFSTFSTFGKIFGKFREIFGHSKPG